MSKKNIFTKLFILFILISALITLLVILFFNNKESALLNQRYQTIEQEYKQHLKTLIENKQNATLAIAIGLAENIDLKASLKQKQNNLHLDRLSTKLREHTKFKNVWIQIIDDKGHSIYRSWTKKTNDSLTIRPDVVTMLKTKKVQSTISVGRYDMSFKSMVPIIIDDKFFGIIEIITHFNSIAQQLIDKAFYPIVLANTTLSQNLTQPFTNNFIQGHYVANLNANPKILNYMNQQEVSTFFNIKDFKIEKDYFITTYNIQSSNDQNIGYIVSFKKLSDISFKELESFKQNTLIYTILLIIFIAFMMILFAYNRFYREIKKLYRDIQNVEQDKQRILDSQKNIIVLTNGVELQKSNKQLTEFYDEFEDLEDFKRTYRCVCDTFIDMKDPSYVIDIDYDGKNWAEYILANSHKHFKAAVKRETELIHFALNVSAYETKDYDEPLIIITMTDISNEIANSTRLSYLNDNLEAIVNKKTEELKQLNQNLEKRVEKALEENSQKDKILFQQNKMAAMGEMLNNIAHQWRQPLSSIMTSITGVQIQRDAKILTDQDFNMAADTITHNCQYLSQTIEDFRSFFKPDKKQEHFFAKHSILHNLRILDSLLKKQHINIIEEVENGLVLYGYKNEFQQALLNILNNAIDTLISNNDKKNRFIFIQSSSSHLTIKDNGGGIDEEIIDKIFEPYFTTKHQSQGTGIGLYMTQEILTKHMEFKIIVQNSTFEHQNKEHYGLEFIIKFPE